MAVLSINGRGYAQDALLDYQENLKLFIDKNAANELREAGQEEDEQEISDQDATYCSINFTPVVHV